MDIKEVQRKLEFDKICGKLKKYCVSQYGIDRIDNIEIFTSPVLLLIEFSKLNSVKKFIDSGNELNIEGLRDIRDDVERIRIPGNFIQTEKYNWIKDFLRISRIVKSQIGYLPDENNDNIKKLAEGLYSDKVLEHSIESTIDQNGEVRDSASKNLKRIREELIGKRESLRKLLTKLLKRVSEEEYTQEDLITLRDGRSVIPVKVENKRKVPGIIHSSSATGYTVFIEPAETIDLNNEITELSFEEKREVERILRNLSESIARYYNELKVNAGILGELDFIRAKALFSTEFNCIQPDLIKQGFNLQKCFHPILIQKLGKNNVIPLNLDLKEDVNTIVITGPNAGGKTVALKTIGLLQMMYQSGIMVTANEDSGFRIFSKFFVVIGDEQSIENSLSSFSSHLKELKDVTDNSDNNSLILIDEICSGTDPKFGSALSAAVLKYLSDKNCFTVVTTHIGDLKIFAHNQEKFINASLEFNFEKLTPSFNFQIGIPGQSYTFELAEKFKLPGDILKYAATMVVDDEHKIEDMLRELNSSKIAYNTLVKDAQTKLNEADLLAKDYEQKMNHIRQKQKEILDEAKSEAEKIINEGRVLIEKAVKDVKEKSKSVSQIKNEYTESSAKLIPEKEIPETKNIPLRTGDTVKIKNTATKGVITEINKDIAVLNANGLTLKSPLSKLELISTGADNKHEDYKIILAEAFESKLDILKSNKYVNSYRLGNWNEGDSGVTIVELKKQP